MATPLYCSNLNNLVNFSEFDLDDLWVTHDLIATDTEVSPTRYDQGFLIITVERFQQAVIAAGVNALDHIKSSVPGASLISNLSIYIGQKTYTLSQDASVDWVIGNPSFPANMTTAFTVFHDGVWPFTPADPPVARFSAVVNGGTLPDLDLYGGSGATYYNALERPIAFDTGTYPDYLALQQDNDYFLLTGLVGTNVHWGFSNNFFAGYKLVRADAFMTKYVTPCLASPDPFWLPASRTYNFPLDKTKGTFIVDRDVGSATPDQVIGVQVLVEGTATYALFDGAFGPLVDGMLRPQGSVFVQLRILPAAAPGFDYIWRPGNISIPVSTGDTESSLLGISSAVDNSGRGMFNYNEGLWGPWVTTTPPVPYRRLADGFYTNAPPNNAVDSPSKMFYTDIERVLVLGYNEVGSGFTQPTKRVFFQLDLVELADPGSPEYPIEESLPIDIETTIDPGEAVSGFASLLRGEDANLVLNSLNSTMTAYLPFLVDKTDGVARDRPLDLNGQKVTGLSDAEFSEDAITVSQLQALL